MWSNADEVKAFIDGHKDGRWVVGDRFVLPDIEQSYEVIAVRPFKHRGKFRLFVDLEAMCAIDDCGEYFITTKEVHQWMASPHVTRCCQTHRYGFSTPMEHAWKTQEQRAQVEVKRPVVQAPKPPRVGVNEQAVLDALDDLSLLWDEIKIGAAIEYAIGKLPPAPEGKRDTRRQTVVRAVNSLHKDGRIALRDGAVLRCLTATSG